MECFVHDVNNITVFNSESGAGYLCYHLIFSVNLEPFDPCASIHDELRIGGFNAEFWAEGLPIRVFHGSCGATVCGLDGVGVFYVGFAVYRDEFFLGICLGEDDAFPTESKPAVGFIDWFEISVEDVVPVFGVGHL